MTAYRTGQLEVIKARLKEASIGMTRKEIAEALGIPKSGYIAKLMNILLAQNAVIVKRGVDGKRRNIFIYFLNDLREGV